MDVLQGGADGLNAPGGDGVGDVRAVRDVRGRAAAAFLALAVFLRATREHPLGEAG